MGETKILSTALRIVQRSLFPWVGPLKTVQEFLEPFFCVAYGLTGEP